MAVTERRVDELVRRCHAGLDVGRLQAEVLRRLRQVVAVDAAFFATVDPVTLLFTSAVIEEPLAADTHRFLENEVGGEDVNRFTSLGTGVDWVGTLDRATHGDRRTSARYAQILEPAGLGDELRVALRARGRCWGVMCLHREDAAAGFSDGEVRLVSALAPHVGEGLRLAVLAAASSIGGTPAPRGPGVIVVDEDLGVVTANPAAHEWLAELYDRPWSVGDELPFPLRAAVAQAGREDVVGIRACTARGHWLTVHASRLHGSAGRHTALVLEASTPGDVGSLLLDAHGLTAAQRRVAALVLQGRSTRQIVNELHISAYTVQEHLRAVFDRFGVASRRELVAVVLVAR